MLEEGIRWGNIFSNDLFICLFLLFIIITITFFLMKLMPGSPFNDAKLNAEQKEILNEKYGLNDPVATQYLHYLKKCCYRRFW